MDEHWEYRRADLYLADLGEIPAGPDGSHVQGGIRPVVVLQNEVGNACAPTVTVVPVTSKRRKGDRQPTHCVLAGGGVLPAESVALGEQITTIDKRQCLKYLGRLSRQETDLVRTAVAIGISGDWTVRRRPPAER